MQTPQLRAQLAEHDRRAERLTVTRRLEKEADLMSETRRHNPALVGELADKQAADSKQSGSIDNAIESG